MALKVAELFAELGVDASQLDKGVDKAVTTASKSMRQVVDAAEKAGKDAGEGLAGGVAQGVVGVGSDVEQLLKAETSGLDSAAQRIGMDAGDELAQGVERGTQGIGADVEQRFRSETDGLATAGRRVGEDTGGGIGGGILDGLPDLGGGLEGVLGGALEGLPAAAAGPALAVGVGAGAAIVQGVGDALDRGQIESRFEAALGVNETTAERMGAQTGRIYADNFGESMDQVAESQRLVGQNVAGLGDLTDAEMEQINKSVLTTASVFDQDLRMSIAAASQLVRTGMAKDFTEAFDIITVGLQGPANKADDLLETFNEYSTLFRDLGIDGQDALGLINQMVEAGARDSDVAADSLGEFYKRVTDGAPPVVQALSDIGLGAEDIPAKLAAGGDGARTALDQVLDTIRNMKDPLAQERAGVALFGTQWEDLGDAILAADLDTAAADLGRVDGAAANAAGSFDDLGSKVETLKREVSTVASDLATGMLAPLAEAASDDATWEGMGKAIQANVSSSLEMVPFGDTVKRWGDIVADSGLWGDIFGQDAPEPPQALRDILADVRAARVAGGSDKPLFDLEFIDAAGAADAVASIDQVNDHLKLSADLADLAADRAANYLDRIANSSGVDNMLSSVLDLDEAMANLYSSGTINDLSDKVDIRAIAMDSANAAEDTTAILREWIDLGGKAQQEIADVLEFQGADAAVARAGSIRDELVGMMDDAGYTDTQVRDLLETMGLMPDQVSTAIHLSGADEAMAKITLIRDFLMNDDGTSGIPAAIESQITIAISEDRATDAANLLDLWVKDREDGYIDDPLLVSIMGDTAPAQGAVDGFVGETNGRTATTTVGADTSRARIDVGLLYQDIGKLHPTVTVGLKLSDEGYQRLLDAGGTRAFGAAGPDGNGGKPRRAGGGPVVGPGGPTDDLVPIDASNGEWVMQTSAVEALGPDVMAMVNRGQLPAVPMPVGMAADPAGSAGGSSTSNVDQLAAQVATLAKAVAMKGNTYQVNGAKDPVRTAREIDRLARNRVWQGVG